MSDYMTIYLAGAMTGKTLEEMIYCGNWKCTIYDCERHHLKQPWNVPIRTRNWEPKKGNKCDGLR